MSQLPAGLEQAFRLAAGELGMCTAAWLFLRELAGPGGEAAAVGLRDRLGRSYPVLDAVAARWLAGERAPDTNPERIVAACGGATHVVVVGLETAFLDELVPRLGSARVALLTDGPFEVDWERVLANYGGRVEATNLSDFQRWAGRRSVLLTFVYGARDGSGHVLPIWLRVLGPDVRSQFRSLIGWDVLRAPMYVYPRWLAEVSLDNLSHFA